jgi:DNA-directed RNA polymerase subunit RPC12/RpoP
VRKVICEKCEGEFQTNETLKVDQSIVCGVCAESILAEKKIPADQVQQQIDPTICIGCGMDNGDTDLARLGQLPVCPACNELFKNRPFPTWIKAAFAGMVLLVVFALFWNSRFIHAYYELRRFNAAMEAGDFEHGAAYFISASQRVPENAEIQTYATFYKGLLLLNQDKPAEALELLQSCLGRIRNESDLDGSILRAQIAIAFNDADYDEFLRLSIQMDQKYKAYACKYAQTQDEQYKTKSMATLGRARTLANSMPELREYFVEYEQRILHRLHTKEVIDRNEFIKRYPNGWIKEGEEAS